MRRLLATTVAMSLLLLSSGAAIPALATEGAVDLPALDLEDGVTINLEEGEDTVQELAAAQAPQASEVYKSGARYDTVNHQWVDTYKGKQVTIAIPNSLAELNMETVVEDGSEPEPKLNSIGGTFPFRKFFISSFISMGFGNPFSVPILLTTMVAQNNMLRAKEKVKQKHKDSVRELLHSDALLAPGTLGEGPNPFVLPGARVETPAESQTESQAEGQTEGQTEIMNVSGTVEPATQVD